MVLLNHLPSTYFMGSHHLSPPSFSLPLLFYRFARVVADGFFYFWWMSLGPAVPLFLLSLCVALLDVLYAAWLGA